MNAWKNEKGSFNVKRKDNILAYTYPENASVYELKYIADELPPQLNAKRVGKTLTMDLKEAEKFFGVKFKKGFFSK